MIDVRGLSFGYQHPAQIFDQFDWSVDPGEAWAVLGPSGCGKTTLLYLLAGLRRPSGGDVLVAGRPVGRVRRQTGLILQDHGLLPWAAAKDNAELGMRIQRRGTRGERRARTEAWLRRLGLWEVRDQYPAQLSGGQRQRVAIARTLALEPDLLLMDEPFSSLDAFTREGLQSLIAELQLQQGFTSVIVTHDVAEAVFLGRRILVLSRTPVARGIIIDNPHAGDPEFRNHAEYYERCSEVKALVSGDVAATSGDRIGRRR